MGNQYKGTVGATRRCWPNQILRANCSLNMIPKVDMCTYPVISMFIQILVKCQLSSFVPDASLACTEWRCQKSRSWVHCFRPCHPAPGLAVKKWPSLSENPEAGCYLWELTGLRQVCGKRTKWLLASKESGPQLSPLFLKQPNAWVQHPLFAFKMEWGCLPAPITSLPACKWWTLGFLRVLTPCSPIAD